MLADSSIVFTRIHAYVVMYIIELYSHAIATVVQIDQYSDGVKIDAQMTRPP